MVQSSNHTRGIRQRRLRPNSNPMKTAISGAELRQVIDRGEGDRDERRSGAHKIASRIRFEVAVQSEERKREPVNRQHMKVRKFPHQPGTR